MVKRLARLGARVALAASGRMLLLTLFASGLTFLVSGLTLSWMLLGRPLPGVPAIHPPEAAQAPVAGHAEVKAKEKIKLTVGLPGGSAVHPPALLERFEELNPDIELEPVIFGWGTFFEKLTLMLAAGVAPDVWYGESGRAFGWYESGFLEDLGPYVKRDLDPADYFMLDAAKDPKTGVWTGIPGDFQVTSLFYNTEHFKSAGLPFPDERWSTAELVAAAEKMTDLTFEGSERWGFNAQPEYITAGWMMWMRLHGGGALDPTRTRSRLPDPENVQALESLIGFIYEDRISPAPGMYGFEPWQAVVSFQDGRSSMMLNIYSWNRQLKDVGMDTYDVAVTPVGPAGQRFTTAVPNVWVINEHAPRKQKEAAWRWIKFQIGEEAQRVRMAMGAGVPVNRSVAFDFASLPAPPENRRIYLDSYAFAGTLEENAVWAEYRQAVEEALKAVWSAEITPEEGLARAHAKVRALLEGA